MTIFEFDDYRAFLTNLIALQPKKGRGTYKKIAQQLSINSVVVSQIFAGKRDFTPEQTVELSTLFSLSDLERDYLLLLIQKERASTEKLKKIFRTQLKILREKSQILSERLPVDKQLSAEEKSVFYSNWIYSATRLMTDIEKFRDPVKTAEALQLPISTVRQALKFLLDAGLCVAKDGQVRIGPLRTHLGADSPLIATHHTNWRNKSMQKMNFKDENDLFYTGPMTLDEQGFNSIRKQIVEVLESVRSTAVDAKSERLVCLNVDLFDVAK